MKKLIFGISALIFSLSFLFLSAQPTKAGYVNGYYKSNGTYVQGYYRSNANGLKYDNYSYKSYQPLYNKSYFNSSYSSSWRTPSYYTDSLYYTGLNSYKSKKSSYFFGW